MTASIVSVNVGEPRIVAWYGRAVETAIFKEPVAGAVLAAGVNLAGDDQADRRVHGGPDKAIYAYALEDYRWWWEQLGREVAPATFGENLTTTGIDLTHATIGDRWSVGGAVLEVSQPREPCFKLGIRMGDSDFVDRFADARRPGTYVRIIEPGLITAGDEIVVAPASTPAIEVGELVGDIDLDLLQRIVADARVPEGWRTQADRALRRAGATG